jgi:hypothetical protein
MMTNREAFIGTRMALRLDLGSLVRLDVIDHVFGTWYIAYTV